MSDSTHSGNPIRVLVVDDHQIVRDGLVSLLGALDGMEVVGAAADGREAIHLVAETSPDVVVMDIQMPGLDGIEATRFVTGAHDVRVVMLTMNEDDETIMSAIRAGASGYLLKGAGAGEVLRAVQAAAEGGMVFGASLAGRVASYLAGRGPAPVEQPFPELNDRERSVLDLLAAGRTNDQIARELYVSSKTVRNAVSSIYAKLHAAGRAEAIIKAREAGLGKDR